MQPVVNNMTKPALKIKDSRLVIPADSAGIADAVKILRSGGVIVYPTETVYGLGCDATLENSVRRAAGLKERAGAFIVLVASIEMVEQWAGPSDDITKTLASRFWPGPLTLVLQTIKAIPASDERGAVGFRVSSDPVCRALCSALGKPMISTSANPRGLEPARDAESAARYFDGKTDCILDDGPRRAGVVSTVLDLTGETPRLVREGAVPIHEIERLIGRVHHD
jgi:L-threonylcarbamoyladenylate synthase